MADEPVPETTYPAFVKRIAESIIVAIVSSATLYLVGSVYVDAYYSRLAIDVVSLDLPPPYVALQSIHALWGLLNYPLLLTLGILLYRAIASPSRPVGLGIDRIRERLPRLLPVLTNLVVVAPLLLSAAKALRARELPHRSVSAELSSALAYVGLAIFCYVIWLGWDRRRFVLSDFPARNLLTVSLLFAGYLLSALVFTGNAAEIAAVDLLTGASPASLRVTFVTEPGVLPELADQELLLVATRNGSYFVVVREPSPPGAWATSYSVPLGSVEAARVRPFHDSDAK